MEYNPTLIRNTFQEQQNALHTGGRGIEPLDSVDSVADDAALTSK